MKSWIIGFLVLAGLNWGLLSPASDFNGDGTDDVTIFRPSSGLWAIRGISRIYFGTWNDEPVPGDYNGNGADEVGIYRATTGLWALRGVSRVYFGSVGDLPIGGSGGSDGDWYRSGDNLCALAAGNIGIGTGNPQEKLHLYDQAVIPDIRLERGMAGETWDIGGGAGLYLNFVYNNVTMLTCSTDGKVGIGETNPAQKLHVAGNNPRILIEDNASSNPEINFRTAAALFDWAIYMDAATSDLRLYEGGDVVTIQSTTGNFGIGTQTPARKLHVNNVMRLEPRSSAPSPASAGDLYFDSSTNKLRCYDGTQWQNCW